MPGQLKKFHSWSIIFIIMGGAWLHMEIWELLSDACLLFKSFHEQNLCENIFIECNNGSCNIWRDHRVRLTCAAIFALPRASWTHWRRFLNCSFSCTSFGGFTLQPIYNNASKIHFSHRLLEVLNQPQGVKKGMSYPFQLPFPYFYFDSISNSRCRKGNSGVPVNFEILVLAIC